MEWAGWSQGTRSSAQFSQRNRFGNRNKECTVRCNLQLQFYAYHLLAAMLFHSL